MSTPREEHSLPLIHDPDSAVGSSFPGLDEAPTQVKPHASLGLPSSVPDASESANTQLLGARLDHFELLDSIGVGGMGRVFRARDTRLDRLVALKVLSPELSNDTEICRRFEQEAKAAARLDDRHFARVYFFGYDKGLRYIAMEYVEGENIRQKIARAGKLNVALAINVGTQIARGLAHAAACGVVHRDIKPSNIILTPDGTAKLVDMGLARNFFQQSSPSSELTQAGVTLGTFDYISPEQALDPRDADVRSDIYSLGCTLYHALTGRPPFSKGSALQKILQHQNDAVPDPRRFVPDLPEPVVSILLKMLAKDPRDRYQHPAELIDDMRAVASLLEISLPDEQGQGAPVRLEQGVWERQLAWAAPLALLVIGIAIYAYVDRPRGPSIPAPAPVAEPALEEKASPVNVEAKVPAPPPLTPSISAEPNPVRDRQAKRMATTKTVAPDADLWSAIQDAESGTALLLLGNRYVLNAPKDKGWSAVLIEGKDLRIEPAAKTDLVEIVIRPSAWDGPASAPMPTGSSARCILGVENSTVELNRLALLVEPPPSAPAEAAPPANPPPNTAVVRLVGGSLQLSDCFLRLAGPPRAAPIAAIELDSSSERKRTDWIAERVVFVGADEIARVVSTGETNIELVDCAADHVGRIPFRFEGVGDVFAAMDHTCIRAASPTMFRANRLSGLRVQAHQCVFASGSSASADPAAPFVEFLADGTWQDASDSWWTGRGNLFHGYEKIVVNRTGAAIARGFTEARKWGFDDDGSRVLRGAESAFVSNEEVPLGMSVDTGKESLRRVALRGEVRGAGNDPVGVRRTPWGGLYAPEFLSASNSPQEVTQPKLTANSSEATKPSAAPPRTLIVDPTSSPGQQPGLYTRVRTAIEEALDDSTILLRCNGPIAAAGWTVSGKRITLRPAEGFAPILVVDSSASMENATSLARVSSGGALLIAGVPIIANAATDALSSIFEVQPGGALLIRDAWVRVNTERDGHAPAVFRIRGASYTNDGAPLSKLEILRSTIRTNGNLVLADAPDGWSISATDSFMATGATVVQSEGKDSGATREVSDEFKILRTTILAGGALVALGGPTGSARPVTVKAEDALILGRGGAPFASANAAKQNASKMAVRWDARQSFVAGFGTFWSCTRVDSPSAPPITLTFASWAQAQGFAEESQPIGSSAGFPLRTGDLAQEPPPNLEQLRQAGYPADMGRIPGVNAQLLPTESVPKM